MSLWYSKVSKDISCLPECIDYFYKELDQAKKEVKIYGNIEKSATSLPGIVEHRFNQLQEIEAVLEHLNIELKRVRTKYFRKYLEQYQRSLSSRDAEKFADGEQDVVDMENIINEFALLRNHWLGIIKGIDQKGFTLNNIIKLRVAGLEDATI